MKRVIVVGSPRSNGRSAHLAEMLFEACIDECPEDELYLAPVSELDIAGCIACDACKRAGELAAQARLVAAGIIEAPAETARAEDAADVAEGGDDGESSDDLLPIPYCPRFDDDMLELYDVLVDADELIVVSPVFFSGAPAGLTALLDRLQPYFWEWMALRAAGDAGAALASQKRPATLHVIGEGLDKNGYIALVSKVRSALAPAGFKLERVLDWVGKIDADGTIQGEAEELTAPALGIPLVARGAYLTSAAAENAAADAAPAPAEQRRERPKLDLSGSGRKSSKPGNAKSGSAKPGNAKPGNARSGAPRSGKSGGPKKNGKRRG